jgi:hypothetical protein
MGLIDLINKKDTNTPDPNQLNVQDLEFLLNTLKGVSIKGEQVEHFYNLIVKLQNQYLALTKK